MDYPPTAILSRVGLPQYQAMTPAEQAFKAKGFQAFPFQIEVWNAIAQGQSGLLHASTGTGKTFAIWGGLLNRFSDCIQKKERLVGLKLLWVTPMRALAHDTHQALDSFANLALPGFRVGLRTGDTSASERARQEKSAPQALVTTPESLCLLLSKPHGLSLLHGVEAVVADEWHELLGNKRGVQLQLVLAALVSMRPNLIVWGLSATLGNLRQAADVLCYGLIHRHRVSPCLVTAKTDKPLIVSTLLPDQTGRFPWAGHLGLSMRDQVVSAIDQATTTLIFTNTRAQAELWYQALLEARPDWAGMLAIHHGSLDPQTRRWVELSLGQGILKAVVATSSLDLGVDFSPVEQVLQIGSPKGIARLLQRAGRSGHQPGKTARLTLVPTHALEILESFAAQAALKSGQVESRTPPEAPMDVLIQHLATRVLGHPMDSQSLYQEVCTAYSFRELSRAQFDWALSFLVHGGTSLSAYPDFHRIQADEKGCWQMPNSRTARRHRLSIGTIVSDASIRLVWASGGNVGQIEESFIGRLKPGDRFFFSGRALELVRIKDLTAYVRLATQKAGVVPRWQGGSMPLTSHLSGMLREVISGVAEALPFEHAGSRSCDIKEVSPAPSGLASEIQALWPLLVTQATRSHLPKSSEILLERYQSREGLHVFIYPFSGRTVHLGLATLVAFRISQWAPVSLSYAVNDYGLEFLVTKDDSELLSNAMLRKVVLAAEDHLEQDLVAALRSGGLAQRRFREIARIAGLVSPGLPGAQKSSRQLAASSNLFYEVFEKYDPSNILLKQSWQEVQRDELNIIDLRQAIARCRCARWVEVSLRKPSPFCFPLMVERLREQLSSEKLSDRVARMLQEAQADA